MHCCFFAILLIINFKLRVSCDFSKRIVFVFAFTFFEMLLFALHNIYQNHCTAAFPFFRLMHYHPATHYFFFCSYLPISLHTLRLFQLLAMFFHFSNTMLFNALYSIPLNYWSTTTRLYPGALLRVVTECAEYRARLIQKSDQLFQDKILLFLIMKADRSFVPGSNIFLNYLKYIWYVGM